MKPHVCPKNPSRSRGMPKRRNLLPLKESIRLDLLIPLGWYRETRVIGDSPTTASAHHFQHPQVPASFSHGRFCTLSHMQDCDEVRSMSNNCCKVAQTRPNKFDSVFISSLFFSVRGCVKSVLNIEQILKTTRTKVCPDRLATLKASALLFIQIGLLWVTIDMITKKMDIAVLAIMQKAMRGRGQV